MADFVPFRSASGFRPHVFADQLAPLVEGAQPETIAVDRPAVGGSVPDHGAGAASTGLDRTMPASAESQLEPEPVGPTAAEIEAMIAEAEARGREEGQADAVAAVAAVEARANEEFTRLQAVVDGVEAYRETLAQEARDACGRLVVQALRRVAMRTPEVLDAVLEARCAEVAENMLGTGPVTIRVHPDDVKLAERLLGERGGWTLVADRSVKGGCIAESEAGRMDASLDAGLDAIQEAVKAWRAESKGNP
ncbi:MAG: FliH/SctL family protein [Myxococcota bacterium]|nr:FliH/SctL family protein [Myxococcota bacterium]